MIRLLNKAHCSYCGAQGPTAGMYLQAASNRKMIKGFYSDLSIGLCNLCLTKALNCIDKTSESVLDNETKEE